MDINKDTTIAEVLEKSPKKASVLTKFLNGQCFGCPMSQIETLEEACLHHGTNLEDLLKALNKESNE